MEKPKKVRLINNKDLYTLLGFANATEYCMDKGRIDLAKESIEKFKKIINAVIWEED